MIDATFAKEAALRMSRVGMWGSSRGDFFMGSTVLDRTIDNPARATAPGGGYAFGRSGSSAPSQ